MAEPTTKPGFSFPGPVPTEALTFFRAKKLQVGFDYRDVWREEHATAFTAAKAMNMDVLLTLRDGVDQALAEGKTFAQFKRELTPLLQRLGWWGVDEMPDPVTGERRLVQLGSPRRLKTIYDANLRTARAAGQWERIQRNRASHPYLLYRLGPSENHREQHVRWSGLLLPVDDPFWKTHFPPNGWGCKCWIRQVSQREYERLKATGDYLTEAPAQPLREWINKRTGEVEQVPDGIDPGWDTNPGAAGRLAQAEQRLQEKQAAYTVTMAKPQPAAVWAPGGDAVFSTVRGIDRAGIESALTGIPGAQPQLETLGRFLSAHPVKVLALKAGEISRGKASAQIAPTVAAFLGERWQRLPQLAYTTRRASRVNGFTSPDYEHVVVKVKATDRLSLVEPAELARAVESAIDKIRASTPLNDTRAWSIRAALDELTDERRPNWLVTMLHEMGHQVHYWAGTPARPPGSISLTEYGAANAREWHAEHFVAWVLNRAALAQWRPEVADYFDNLLEQAIMSSRKEGNR